MKKGKKKQKKSSNNLLTLKKDISKNMLIIFALLCLLIVSFLTHRTYSFWNETTEQTNQNVVEAGCFEVEFNDKDINNVSTSINLVNTFPMQESTAIGLKPYKVQIVNVCDIPTKYNIVLNEFNNTTLSNSYIRYQITELDETIKTDLLSNAEPYVLDNYLKQEIELSQRMSIVSSINLGEGYLEQGESTTYELRLWIDYDAPNETMNKIFEAAISVLATSPN